MWVGLLTDRIDNKLEKRNLLNEHALAEPWTCPFIMDLDRIRIWLAANTFTQNIY